MNDLGNEAFSFTAGRTVADRDDFDWIFFQNRQKFGFGFGFFVYRRMRIENVDFQHLTRGINDSQLAAGPKRRIDAEDHFAFQRRLQKQTFNVH